MPSAIGLAMASVLLYLSIRQDIRRRRAGALRLDGVLRLDVQKSIVTATALVVALGCLTQIGVNQMMTPPNPLIMRDPVTASTAVQNAVLFVVVDAALIILTAYRLLQLGALGREMKKERAISDAPSPRDPSARTRATDGPPEVDASGEELVP